MVVGAADVGESRYSLEGERAGASLGRDGNGWPQNGIHLPEVCHVDTGILREAALKLDLVHSARAQFQAQRSQ